MKAHDGKWLEAAGLVLVGQRPDSAKGVMFITIEDRSGVANLVVWVKTFEKYRRVVLAAGIIGVYGKVQRESSVVHLVAHRLMDLSDELAGVGESDSAFPIPHGRGDEFRHGSPAPDPSGIFNPRDIWDPTKYIEQIRVKTRDFR